MDTRKILTCTAALALLLGGTVAQAATVAYQLTDCNTSSGCSPQFGNNFGTVTVTDFASGVVDVNVNLAASHFWVNTDLTTFSFTLAPGLATPSLTFVTTDWTPASGSPLTSLNTDGMGSQQYGLNFEGKNSDKNGADLNFRLTAAGLSTASFVLGGVSGDTGLRYHFLADICTKADGSCGAGTGLVGDGNVVPIPAAAWLLGTGLLGLLGIGRRRKVDVVTA